MGESQPEKPYRQRPIFHPAVAAIISSFVLGAVVFVVAELYRVRRLDGVWECTLTSYDSKKPYYRYEGIVLSVSDNSSLSGSVGPVSVRQRGTDQDEFKEHQPGPTPFTGSVLRAAFIIPARVRIVSALDGVPIVLDLPIQAERKLLKGKYASKDDQGKVECKEQEYFDRELFELVKSVIVPVAKWMLRLVLPEPPPPTLHLLPKGWIRSNGYRLAGDD